MDFKVAMPILGFDDLSEATLEPVDGVFYRLSGKREGAPSFTLIQPAALRDDYVVELPPGAEKKLRLEREEDALVLNIMVLDTPLENSLVNFRAPLVFNKKEGVMGQVVLDEGKHPTYGLAEPLKKFLSEESS